MTAPHTIESFRTLLTSALVETIHQYSEHLRGEKLVVFKMKRRKRYRNKKGHRQELTKVVVTDIKLS